MFTSCFNIDTTHPKNGNRTIVLSSFYGHSFNFLFMKLSLA